MNTSVRADGAVVISVDLDDKNARKKLEGLRREMKKAEGVYSEKSAQRDTIGKELAQKNKELEETAKAIQFYREEMKGLEAALDPNLSTEDFSFEEFIRAKERLEQCKASLADMEAIQGKQNTEAATLGKKYQSIDKATQKAAENLERVKKEAQDTVAQMRGTGVLEKASGYVAKFAQHIKVLAKRVLVFSVIVTAFRKLKELMAAAIEQNNEASAAFARLRGALLTLARPIIETVLPVFTALSNILARVVNAAARLLSALFGKSYAQVSKNAKALNAVGDAAKRANKYLAPFDELNTIDTSDNSGGAGGSMAPIFDGAGSASPLLDVLAGKLKSIGKIIGSIGGDIKDLLHELLTGDFPGVLDALGSLEGHLREIISNIVLFVGEAVGGIIDWVIEKLGLAGTPIGNALAALKGMVMDACSFISALLLGDLDGMTNALSSFLKNTQELCFNLLNWVQESIDKFFVWLDEKTGGKFHWIIQFIRQELSWLFSFVKDVAGAAFASLKEMLTGIIDFIGGVFTGDWARAWDGVKKIFLGIATAIAGVFGSVLNVVIRAINWVIAQINKIDIKLPSWLGGKEFSPKLKPITEFQIPRLAQGAVIPANREFLAVLGDQRHGTNIEAPADLIRQIVREEIGNASGGTHVTIVLDSVDGKKLFDTFVRENNAVVRATGASPLKV